MQSIVEVFTHLKALYEEQWGDAEATAPPEVPGCVEVDPVQEDSKKAKTKITKVRSPISFKKGRTNMPPKDSPVSIIEHIQSRILPMRFDSGIHNGTERLEGIM